MSHADDLQAVSVDEALIEVSSKVARMRDESEEQDTDSAKDLAEIIRTEIREATGCEGILQFVAQIKTFDTDKYTQPVSESLIIYFSRGLRRDVRNLRDLITFSPLIALRSLRRLTYLNFGA